MPLTLDDVNAMSPTEFVGIFADVAEHSPWVAEAAARARPYASREAMVEAFGAVVTSAGSEARLALLRAHPDLAGRAAMAGDLTADSRSEQAVAGLDSLTRDEFARFTDLNRRYRETFGFPFILAVKGADKHTILAAFEARIGSDPETEFTTAIAQVCRILRLRIEDRVRR